MDLVAISGKFTKRGGSDSSNPLYKHTTGVES